MVLLVTRHQGIDTLVEIQTAEVGDSWSLCVSCALFIDHIGYIFLKTKNMIDLHHQNLQKLKKKEGNLFSLCTPKRKCFL